jgi:putative transposase
MRRVEIQLELEEREILKAMCSFGVASVRVLQRVLTRFALDQGIQDQQIAAVLQIERTHIWLLRQRYRDDGLEAALYERPRSGRPTE